MQIYGPQEDKKLSWPEMMRVNNLIKVIMRQQSGNVGIWTCAL